MPTELGINERNVNAKMRIEGEPADGWFTPTVDQKFRLGTRGEDDEGNVYYYAENGAVALTTGNLIATAILNGATTTAQEDLVVGTSSAIGDKFGYATILTTAQTTVDLFVDGTYSVAAGTAAQGRGSTYKIKSHPNPLTEPQVRVLQTLQDNNHRWYGGSPACGQSVQARYSGPRDHTDRDGSRNMPLRSANKLLLLAANGGHSECLECRCYDLRHFRCSCCCRSRCGWPSSCWSVQRYHRGSGIRIGGH